MKKLIILIGFIALVGCQKQVTCILTNTYSTPKPCEGYPEIQIFVYEFPANSEYNENFNHIRQICHNGKEVTLQSNQVCK